MITLIKWFYRKLWKNLTGVLCSVFSVEFSFAFDELQWVKLTKNAIKQNHLMTISQFEN
jgi:hypothetical protein